MGEARDVTGTLIGGGAVLGLLIGSFLNVIAHRVPRHTSLLRPRSACPSCGTRIRATDNIPVLSFLLLRGRCRSCRARISIRYPLVEGGTALVFAGLAWMTGPSWVLPAYWVAGSVALVLAVIDLDLRRIPNAVLLPGTGAAWLLLVGGSLADGDQVALLRAAAGGAGHFTLLLVLAVASRGGFGFGDVKLGFLLGTFLAYRSWGVFVVGVFASFVLGGAAGAWLLLRRRAGRKTAIPFGPAMVLGAAASLAWGERIAAWYLGT
jgi:leader peptidase (prepilin peptidase)/N-methyltransferase